MLQYIFIYSFNRCLLHFRQWDNAYKEPSLCSRKYARNKQINNYRLQIK